MQNGSIDRADLRAMVLGLEIIQPRRSTHHHRHHHRGHAELEETVDVWMKEFDKANTGHITLPQFQQGMSINVCSAGKMALGKALPLLLLGIEEEHKTYVAGVPLVYLSVRLVGSYGRPVSLLWLLLDENVTQQRRYIDFKEHIALPVCNACVNVSVPSCRLTVSTYVPAVCWCYCRHGGVGGLSHKGPL